MKLQFIYLCFLSFYIMFSTTFSQIIPDFQVNENVGGSDQSGCSIAADSSGNFVITLGDDRDGEGDVYAQRYSSDGSTVGSPFKITKTGFKFCVDLRNGRIYNTWIDNRDNETGYEIWANVLDWDNPVGIDDREMPQTLSTYKLSQNFPNPFNPTTTIEFSLPKSEFVTLNVFNILGKEVGTVVNDEIQAGNHTYQFDGSNLASGVYIYKIEAGEFSKVMKMILLK